MSIDIIAQDISIHPDEQQWVIININASPNLIDQHYPVSGKSRNIASILLKHTHNQVNPEKETYKYYQNIAPIWYGKPSLHRYDYPVHKELLTRSAMQRNLKVIDISKSIYYVASNKKRIFFYKNVPDRTSHVSKALATTKHQSKEILKMAGIIVPRGRIFSIQEVESAIKYAKSLACPIVVKPDAGSGGKGVITNISDEELLIKAIVTQRSKKFVVEEYIEGNECRVMVVNGQFVAAMQRIPANVIGDGVHTINQLITIKNKARKLIPHLGKSLIKISPFVIDDLQKKSITVDTILPQGKVVSLQTISNAGAGGDSEDITEKIHEGFQHIAIKALNAFPSMFYCGLDIQAKDFTIPPDEQKWAILEINENPDTGLHHFPWTGKGRDVAGTLIDSLFPELKENNNKTANKSVNVIISGKVQKVGYRKWLEKQAYLYAINGWVTNLKNDKVEAVFSGMPNAVDFILEQCKKGPKSAIVNDLQIKTIAPMVVDKGFFIK